MRSLLLGVFFWLQFVTKSGAFDGFLFVDLAQKQGTIEKVFT
jgi:hypothetical protein